MVVLYAPRHLRISYLLPKAIIDFLCTPRHVYPIRKLMHNMTYPIHSLCSLFSSNPQYLDLYFTFQVFIWKIVI